MADRVEIPDNIKSVRKHTRQRYFHFLKFVEKNLGREIESSAWEETEDEACDPNLSPETKKRRLNSDIEDSDQLNSERTKQIFNGNNGKQKKASGEEMATDRLSNRNTDMHKFIECDSDIDEVKCEEAYWFENEVVFIPANQRKTPLEFIVKKEK